MLDLVDVIKKRMKWRKPPEITDYAYEISRLKHEAIEFVLRLDDIEKAIYSSVSKDVDSSV